MSENKVVIDEKGEQHSGTIEDVKESVSVLERLANIFKIIFEIFKSKEK